MLRRAVPLLLALAVGLPAAVSLPQPSQAQRREPLVRPSGPPHAWLFGSWTGGLFPVLDGMEEQDCRTQATVVFSQDVVAHAGLTSTGLTRRVIETVRTTAAGAEFRFSPNPADTDTFGCEDPNELHVARENDTTISFPRCAAFPYPLRRCPAGR